MRKNENSGEREILRAIRAVATRTASKAVRVGIGDDCAVLAARRGEELVITTDLSIEDRHFRRSYPPEAVGYKCLARGLSDIAAMGARPVAAFVSLAVPQALGVPRGLAQLSRLRPAAKDSWINRFYSGLLDLAEREHVTLAGGDLSESPSLAFADIVVVGAAARGRALLRSGARVGDVLYVTGTLGGAAAELAALKSSKRSAMGSRKDNRQAHPHFYPQPRLATGRALARRRLATACIDISDGLSTDLLHLCEESDLAAELDRSAIPLATWNGKDVTLEQALHGGDDYELLFTAAPHTRIPRRLGEVTIRSIGRMTIRKRGPRITLLANADDKAKRIPLIPKGWQHF